MQSVQSLNTTGKKVRFPHIAGAGKESANDLQRTVSDVLPARAAVGETRSKSLTKQNSERIAISPATKAQDLKRQPTKRSISLDAFTVEKLEKFDAVKKEPLSEIPNSKKEARSPPSKIYGEPEFGTPISRMPSMTSTATSKTTGSDIARRKVHRHSPTSPLVPISPPEPGRASAVASDTSKRKGLTGSLDDWEQLPAQALQFLEDLNARPMDQMRKAMPKKTVSYDEIFRAMQTKEELGRKYSTIQDAIAETEQELKVTNEKINDVNYRLSIAEGEWQESLEAVAKSESRKHRVENYQQQCLEEADQKERSLREKIEAELELDQLTAELSTLHVIKKAVQLRLFQASEEKNSVIQSKKSQEEVVEGEKSSLSSRIGELTHNNTRHEEMLERAKFKLSQQVTAEKGIEDQLSKARDQVVSLIEQIGQKEASEAREFRAQRVAKEAEARAKHKHPTGSVTLVFTDVQGSTAQWEMHPDVMSVALELHNSILRAKLQLTGGYEVRTEGDSFMVAFHTPLSAVWWCIFVQQALLEADWPAKVLTSPHSTEERADDGSLLFRGIRVRMGAHVGKTQTHIDALTGRMDYFGPMVNRAAKISGLGKGGQVLLSGSVWNAVKADIGNSVIATNVGDIKLKGMEQAEDIVQILPLALAKRKFPPLKPLTNIHQSDSNSKLSLARIYQNRMDEELNNSEKSSVEARAKLAVLFKEIETSLAEQEFAKRKVEIARACEFVKKKIRDVRRWSVETEKVLSHSNAELDVMKYKAGQLEEKNALMEQEIYRHQAEQRTYKEIQEEMEAEQQSKRTELLRINALTFALMVRELLSCQSEAAMAAERDLLDRQEKECAEIVKALIDGEDTFNNKLVFSHITERNKLLEQHINLAKRDELEARALLQDANLEYEKYQDELNAQSKSLSNSIDTSQALDIDTLIQKLLPSNIIINTEAVVTRKKELRSKMEVADAERSELEAQILKLEAELTESITAVGGPARQARKAKAFETQLKKLNSEKTMLTDRVQNLHFQIEESRAKADASVASAHGAVQELALRRGILEDQLAVLTRPVQFVVEEGKEGKDGKGAAVTGKDRSEGEGGSGKMHLTLNTASVGLDMASSRREGDSQRTTGRTTSKGNKSTKRNLVVNV